MFQAMSFRISVTFVSSVINYFLIESLSPNQQPSFLLFFCMTFLTALTLGLILHIPKKNIFQLGVLCIFTIAFSCAVAYVLNQGITNEWGPLWVIQAEFSALIIYCFYCAYFSMGQFKYDALFYHSWRILLTIGLATVFALLVWGLLSLGSLLFGLIGINQLSDFIFSKGMAFIGTPVFFAAGVSLLASYDGVLDKCRDILLSFSKALYPLLMSIGLLFFIAIPFAPKSLSDYWGSIYVLMIAHLFLFNGVYQNGRSSSPYPAFFEWPMKLFFVLLPVYLLFAMKYPVFELASGAMKIDHLYAIIIGALLFLYAIGYAISCAHISSTDPWLYLIKPINKILALVTAALFWLMATPVLDLRYWAS